MTGEIVNLEPIASAVLVLADKLGIAVEKLVQIYSEPQATLGFLTLIFSVWVILMWILLVWTSYKYSRRFDEGDDLRQIIPTLTAFVGILVLMVISSVLIDSIMHMKYPVYYGVKELAAMKR